MVTQISNSVARTSAFQRKLMSFLSKLHAGTCQCHPIIYVWPANCSHGVSKRMMNTLPVSKACDG